MLLRSKILLTDGIFEEIITYLLQLIDYSDGGISRKKKRKILCHYNRVHTHKVLMYLLERRLMLPPPGQLNLRDGSTRHRLWCAAHTDME